jgi:tripartite ATP-independent transporter DctM subunit
VLISVLLILALCALIIVSIPIALSMLAIVLVGFLVAGFDPITVPQLTLSGMTRYTLLSLPLFIMAGALMNLTSISDRLFAFASSLVGWLKGGLAQVDILLSMFMGGMVGSSTADIVATGTITIPAMKKHGYTAAYASSVTASSAAIGALIPPSSSFILYSAITGTSLGGLFLAGVLPGLLMGAVLMACALAAALWYDHPREGPFIPWQVLVTGKRAMLSFGVPVLLVLGLAVGVMTPTEAGAFAVVYAVALGIFYRTLNLSNLYKVMVESVQLCGELLFIVSISVAFGWIMSIMRLPDALTLGIDLLVSPDYVTVRLLLICLLAIVLGMFVDPLIPVFVPMVFPIATAMGIDPIHFGIIVVVAAQIGSLTPPLGISLILTSRIGNVDQMRIVNANWPFLIGILICLGLVIQYPQISLWLPQISR